MTDMDDRIVKWAEDRRLPEREGSEVQDIVDQIARIEAKESPSRGKLLPLLLVISSAAAAVLVISLFMTSPTPVVTPQPQPVTVILTVPSDVVSDPLEGAGDVTLVSLDKYEGLFSTPKVEEKGS